MILIARFLYKEADIYLIEDFVRDERQEISFLDMNRIFRDFLLFKTVVFISREPLLIKESKTVYVFQNSELVDKVPTKQFLKNLEKVQSPTGPQKRIDSHLGIRILTNKQRINNSLISSNINFDHELRLHRKTLLKSEKVQKVLRGKSWFEGMCYGIYLTEMKRKEGTNIYEETSGMVPDSESLQMLMKNLFGIVSLNQRKTRSLLSLAILLLGKLSSWVCEVLIVSFFINGTWFLMENRRWEQNYLSELIQSTLQQ